MLKSVILKALRPELCTGRSFISTITKFECKNPQKEETTPIVLVCGEGLNKHSWIEYSHLLSERGYSGFIYEPDHFLNSLDDQADSLNTAITSCGLTPPLLISHSFSSFICQRKSSKLYMPSPVLTP